MTDELMAAFARWEAKGMPEADQTRQIADPLERQRVALAHLEEAREEWKRQAAAWSAVRAEAIFELKEGRTWAEVAELVKVSIPTAWNIAHPK